MTMISEEYGRKIAKALERAASEHGMPNSFMPWELKAYYGAGLNPMQIGRWSFAAVNTLRLRGWKIKYENRRFVIDWIPGMSK